MERVLLVTTKSKASSLRGAAFSSSLRALYLILKKLYQRWCFAAEVVAMFDFWCGFLLNEIRHGWRNKDLAIWRSMFDLTLHLAKTLNIRFCFHGNSSHIVLLFQLRREENTPRDRKNCSKYGGNRNIEVWIMRSYLKEFVKNFSPFKRNCSSNKHGPIMASQTAENYKDSTVFHNLVGFIPHFKGNLEKYIFKPQKFLWHRNTA